jgi:hypothetical protein
MAASYHFFREPCRTGHLGVVQGLVWFISPECVIKNNLLWYDLFSISNFIIEVDDLHSIRCCQSMGYVTIKSYDNIEDYYL